MVGGEFLPKNELIAQLKQATAEASTGFFTILTDSNRSVLLRLSEGSLTRLHSRSNEAGEAIQIMADCELVKFTYASAPADDQPEIMPMQSFLQLINPGHAPGQAKSKQASGVSESVRLKMLDLAVEYVGVIADMIVDEAFEESNDVGRAIDYITRAIPDKVQAKAFRDAAKQIFSEINF